MTALDILFPPEMTRTDKTDAPLNERFAQLRIKNGVSQDAIAEKLGTTQASVGAFETGKTKHPRVGLAAYERFVRDWEADLVQETKADYQPTRTVQCRSCGERVPLFFGGKRLAYCGACAEELGTECSNCGILNDPDAQFCKKCGEPLSESAHQAAQAARNAIDWAKKPKADRSDHHKKEGRKRGEPDI